MLNLEKLETPTGKYPIRLMAHLLASGVRLLWPCGKSYMEALSALMGGKA